MRAMVTARILIVEDQKQPADALQAGLASLPGSLAVTCVSSAEDAMRALKAGEFDLLIADVLLPGISGLELMARFRRRNPKTRVILLSGVQDAEIRKQVARSGADAFFFKPVELADILDAVERLLGLVKSALPSELSVVANSSDATESISQQLAELRFTIQAYSVALVSAQGQVIARAGIIPDQDLERELMPHLMSARLASQRVSSMLGAAQTDDLLVVRGAEYCLHLASVANTYALILVTKLLKPARSAALAAALQKVLPRLAQNLGASQPQPVPTPAAELADTDPHLEKLLDQAETKPSNPKAAERYWKTAELPPLPLPGALSYAQAARIGLAPAEEN